MPTYPSIYAYKYGDLYTLGAYVAGYNGAQNNVELGPMLATGTVIGALPLAKGVVWDAPKWTIQNWGNLRGAYSASNQAVKAQRQAGNAFKGSLKGGENIVYNWMMSDARLQNYHTLVAKANPARISCDPAHYKELLKNNPAEAQAYKATYKASNAATSKCYEEARKILERIKTQNLKGEDLRKALQEFEGAVNKGDLKVLEGIKAGTIKPVGKWAKVWGAVKAKSGYNAVNRAFLKGATHGLDDFGKVIAGVGDKFGSKALRTVSKGAKGGGAITAAIELAFEAPEIVETYKTLGAGAGTKQLGKSAVVATASAVGYVAGAKIGAIAGAKIGGSIGTFIGGPVGAAIGAGIGAIIGVGCGLLGSWLCQKGAKAVVGKSELEKHKSKQALELARNANNSDEGKQKLLENAKAKADKDGGVDDQAVITAYEKLLNERQESLNEGETTQSTQQDYQTYQTTGGKYDDLLAQLNAFNVSGTVASNPFSSSNIYTTGASNQFTSSSLFANNMFGNNLYSNNYMYPSLYSTSIFS